MRVTRVATTIAFALALACVAGPADARWSKPIPLDTSDWWTTQATSAVARNGQTVVAWIHLRANGSDATVRYRRISPKGGRGPVHELSGSHGAAQLDVAVDDDGDLLFAWAVPHPTSSVWMVMAQRVSRTDSVAPMRQLSVTSRQSWLPRVALTSTGGGAVVYEQDLTGSGAWQDVLIRFSKSSAVSRRWDLSTGPAAAPLRATRGGDFLTAGLTSTGAVIAYRLRPGNVLRSRRVSASGQPGWMVSIGTGPKGTAYVAYVATTGKPGLWARKWKRDGGLSTLRRISPRGHVPVNVAISVDRQGDAVVTWPGTARTGGQMLGFSRLWRHSGSVGRVRKLGPSVGWAVYAPPVAPYVAVDRHGDGVVSWTSEKSDGNDVAWARRIHRDGTVGRRRVMLDNAISVFVGVTRSGRARVGLLYNDGLWMRTGP